MRLDVFDMFGLNLNELLRVKVFKILHFNSSFFTWYYSINKRNKVANIKDDFCQNFSRSREDAEHNF